MVVHGRVLELLLNNKKMNIRILFFMLFFSIASYGQENERQGYFNKTKVGVLIRLNSSPSLLKEGNGTEISTVNGWHINNKWSLGLGIAATSYINPTITSYPVFGSVHYYFKNQIRTPFVFTNLGYNALFSNENRGGILFDLGIGYNLRLGKKWALTPELGYKYQDYNRRLIGSDNSKVSLSSLSAGIGILF